MSQPCQCSRVIMKRPADGGDLVATRIGRKTCTICHGLGSFETCPKCEGCGMVNSQVCSKCGGCGKLGVKA